MRVDGQTDRQTVTLIAILQPLTYLGQSNKKYTSGKINKPMVF